MPGIYVALGALVLIVIGMTAQFLICSYQVGKLEQELEELRQKQ